MTVGPSAETEPLASPEESSATDPDVAAEAPEGHETPEGHEADGGPVGHSSDAAATQEVGQDLGQEVGQGVAPSSDAAATQDLGPSLETRPLVPGSVLDGPPPTGPDRPRPSRLRWPRRWWSRTLAVLLTVAVLLGVAAAPSLIHALTRPGADTVAARLAEWGRDHGFGPIITWLETRQYDLHQPPTGGAPTGGIPNAKGSEGDHPGGQPAPPPLPPPAGLTPLPGEGQWQTVVSTPHGDAVRTASVRPDAQHTSFVVGVLWMDPTLVRGVLHPGTEDPGGQWSTPTSVDAAEQKVVVTAFSAGFRLNGDSHGGWYEDGRTARPLVPGAASLVLYRNGTANVGTWGSEVSMNPDVASVRQNLIPLVDNGVVNPTCATGGTKEWGSTVGQAAYIHRSAFGVTPTGAMVYVGGPALSVCTLGELLRSAGVVRGMELDINPAWVSGVYFHPNGASRPDAFQLFPDEQIGTQHYLQTSSRDFFSFDLRSAADTAGAPPPTQRHTPPPATHHHR